MTLIPNILVPIIESEKVSNNKIHDELKNKRVIIFGVPGAFTPTCSEKHLPGFIKLYDSLIKKNIDDIYCLSVNDPFVMKAWLSNYNKHQIKGIADGNGHLSRLLKVKNVSERISVLKLKHWTIVLGVIIILITLFYRGTAEEFIYFEF